MASKNGIIVKSENIDKLQKVLDAANGKARERIVITGDVFSAVDELQEKFKGINKDELLVKVNPNAQKFARCYKGVPMATYMYLLYKNGSWRLLDAKRMPCDTVAYRVLKMSDETKFSILRQFEIF